MAVAAFSVFPAHDLLMSRYPFLASNKPILRPTKIVSFSADNLSFALLSSYIWLLSSFWRLFVQQVFFTGVKASTDKVQDIHARHDD